MKRFLLSLFALILLTACKKEPVPTTSGRFEQGVFLTNEGNFGWSNGSLSFYDPDKKEITNDVFAGINNFALGDVVQSITRHHEHLYIVVNNSARIVVASVDSLHYETTIDIPNSSPRQLLVVNDSTAYISELYADKIWILNLNTNSISGSITVSGWTEKMVLNNNRVYVTQRTRPGGTEVKNVLIVNPENHQILSAISLGNYPTAIAFETSGMLCIATEADVANQQNGLLIFYNLNTQMFTDTISLGSHSAPNLHVSASLGKIFLAAPHVYAVNNNHELQTIASISSFSPYATGWDESRQDIYLSNPEDYLQPSTIQRIHADGTMVDEFTSGITTGSFFYN